MIPEGQHAISDGLSFDGISVFSLHDQRPDIITDRQKLLNQSSSHIAFLVAVVAANTFADIAFFRLLAGDSQIC